jgi:pyruvate dehydrogenase E1 component beta subunit
MSEKTNVQAVHDTLLAEFRRDERYIMLGEDIGRRGGVFRVSDGFIEEFGKDRIIDTPVAESSIVGVAIGAALGGLRPVAEMQFADFSAPAFEQIVDEAARIRYRSNGGYGVPLVIRMPWGGAVHGALYHSQSVEAFYAHVPGLKVVVPSTPRDITGMLRAALRDPDPVIFLEPTRLYRMIREEVPEGEYTVPLGKARIAREGGAVTVVAWGSMLERTMKAAEGYDAEVVDLLTLSPFDEETLLASVRKTGRVVIVHEAPLTCGLGAELAAIIAQEAILHLRGPVLRVAAPDVTVPLAKLVDYYLPSTERIRRALDEILKY